MHQLDPRPFGPRNRLGDYLPELGDVTWPRVSREDGKGLGPEDHGFPTGFDRRPGEEVLREPENVRPSFLERWEAECGRAALRLDVLPEAPWHRFRYSAAATRQDQP